jgi:hypothetical protein
LRKRSVARAWWVGGVLLACGAALTSLAGCGGGNGVVAEIITAILTGRIVAGNTAVNGARVTTDKGQTTTTGANGRFQLVNVPAGQVNLTITATGFDTQMATASVEGGQTLDVGDISLTPAGGGSPPPPPGGGGNGNPPGVPFP